MGVSKEQIENKISWFNQEVERFKTCLLDWLQESGHAVEISEEEFTKVEELPGSYKTRQYKFIIDDDLRISIKPFGIWIIGAKGRIDVLGPSGSEKFIFLSIGDTNMPTDVRDATGGSIEKSGSSFFKNVDEDDWYWYDDSSYRKVSKLSKEVVEPLLERLQ